MKCCHNAVTLTATVLTGEILILRDRNKIEGELLRLNQDPRFTFHAGVSDLDVALLADPATFSEVGK